MVQCREHHTLRFPETSGFHWDLSQFQKNLTRTVMRRIWERKGEFACLSLGASHMWVVAWDAEVDSAGMEAEFIPSEKNGAMMLKKNTLGEVNILETADFTQLRQSALSFFFLEQLTFNTQQSHHPCLPVTVSRCSSHHNALSPFSMWLQAISMFSTNFSSFPLLTSLLL